jgi:hypothetical protein
MRFYWAFVPPTNRLYELNKRFQLNAESLSEALRVLNWAYVSRRNPLYVEEYLRIFTDVDYVSITVGSTISYGRNFYKVKME